MKILVIGGGGREHAIIKKLRENPEVDDIYALPGNAGIGADAWCFPISATDLPAILDFTDSHPVDYAVVTPDDPLVLGTVDALNARGIPCFGPTADAAIIEGSKIFSKRLMQKYNIPTAACEIFTDLDEALAYLEDASYPAVIKADGLALGKGVIIASDYSEAESAVRGMMQERMFGDSGSRIVIEEYLEGPEVSVLSFTDGETIVPMVSSMDHKRALDGDLGPNTGGMGTIAPNPYYTPEIADRCMREIFLPTVRAMKEEGRVFRGCLYFGLMITADGPKVIEYNCRFGDPETQVVLPLLKTDLLTVMKATTEGTLSDLSIEWKDECACCVVMASGGYPRAYKKGYPILVDEGMTAEVYFAGTKEVDGELMTAGGRVLGVTSTGATLAEAINKAYDNVLKIHFKDAFYRHDIGARALRAKDGQ